jgi:O-antigen/teichoic acid export membrane protein
MRIWSDKNLKEFKRRLRKQVFILIGLSVPVIIAGYFIGIPFLNIIYGVNLDRFKNMFMFFLWGGSLNALAVIFLNLGIIFRKQHDFMAGYIIATTSSIFFTYFLISKFGFMGSALAYFMSMTILCIIFAILVFYNLKINNSEANRS